MAKDDLKQYVLEKVDSTTFYLSRFPKWNPQTKANVTCVFHRNDRKPSLSINLKNGGARCFAASCHESIGNIVHFESVANKISEEEAATRLYNEFIRPVVSIETIATFHKALVDEKLRGILSRATGLNGHSIETFQLGYDERTRRFTIPVFNRFNLPVNIRFYRPKSIRRADDIKIYSYVRNKGLPNEIRYGNIELFPWPLFHTYTTDKPLFFMASEKETMLAIQLGLQAVCSQNGEGSWSDEWVSLFEGFEMGILFDPDEGGMKAATKVVATLQPLCVVAIALILPFPSDYRGDKDFDDWILSKTGNQFELLNLFRAEIESTPSSLKKSESLSEISTLESPKLFDEKIHELVSIRVRTDMLNLSVKTRGIIAAVSSKSFDVPWRFKVRTKTGTREIGVTVGRELVSFVGSSDAEMIKILELAIGSPILELKPLEWVSISEVEIVPIAEVSSDEEGRYVSQRCFILGKSIDSNVPYEMTVVPTTLIKTQEKVLIVTSTIEVARSVDTWTFAKKTLKEFQIFQPTLKETVDEKLYQIADEIASNYTKIFSRPDWHIVCLLTWLSPVGWYFPGETSLQRGWINSLAIGDTKTGKSQVAITLQKLFKLGDIVNAENCTFVGLVGGAIKTGSGQMMLRWGRLPLCDKKLVVIEELSGLSIQEISNMSEVRSRGIARLDKGGLASQTPARTRLLALSNTRAMRKALSEHLSGVKAIQELIGHPEDISRFDLIVTLIDSEVESDVINRPLEDSFPSTFTSEQLHHLCQFIWALKPNQVHFSDDAYLACLDWTKRLQQVYHPSVPIFKAADGRFLLARIGAAIAALQFSWDGEKLIVDESHIQSAVNFLRSLYDKPSFGYLEFSKQMQDREVIKLIDDLEKAFRRNLKPENVAPTIESLIHSAKFSRDELAAIGSMELFMADDLIGYLLRSRVIRKGEANTWEITPAGKQWLLLIKK